MKQKKIVRYGILMMIGIIVNLVGKWIATTLQLPLWLDAIGTGVTSCLLGPIWGAVCGVINNMVNGLADPLSLAYGLTSAAIGIVMGICMRKGMFRDLFHAMTTSVIVALVSVVISTPLNLLNWGGMIGNVWGDGLFGMLTSHGMNAVVASGLGELFVDFPDKVVVVLITYALLRLPILQQWFQTEQYLQEKVQGTHATSWKKLLFMVPVLLYCLTMTVVNVDAAKSEEESEQA